MNVPDPDSLSLEAAIGQLICPTLYHGLDRSSQYDPVKAAEALDQYGWGGYIVFHDQADAMRDRLSTLQSRAKIPLLVAADMEHGAGMQLYGLSVFPTAMTFGATNRPEYAYELGALTAQEARSAGVNWLFAPVADVTNNPENPIINIRSFGGYPERVCEMVAAFVRGAQEHGVLACAKHFPGHGDTGTDSHTSLGTVAASRDRLEAVEFPPFRAAIGAGVAAIMTAHLAVPALDDPGVPATLSEAIIGGILRRAWHYDGLVVTDALIMGGITQTLDQAEAAVRAIAAGCDMLLMPANAALTHAALHRAVQEGRLPESRIRESARRVLAAKTSLDAPTGPAPRLTPDELTRRVARESLTLARGEVPPLAGDVLAIAVDDGAEENRLAAWQHAVQEHGLGRSRTVSLNTTEDEWHSLFAEAEQAGSLVLGLFSPIRIHKDRSLLPEKLLTPLQRLTRSHPAVVISFSSPFLVAQFPEASAWVLAYGMHPVQIDAAIQALREGRRFSGVLPVELPGRLAGAKGGRQVPDDKGPAFA